MKKLALDEKQQKVLIEGQLEDRLRDLEMSDRRIKDILAQRNMLDEYATQTAQIHIDADVLNALEYIPVEMEGEVRDREQSWLAGGEDDEDEEDFEWIKILNRTNPKSLQEETYFTLVNQMRKPMRKGEQAWNCYGNRTNIFLLVNYGFCFPDNLHDSMKFFVRLDIDFKHGQYPSVGDMIPKKNSKS